MEPVELGSADEEPCAASTLNVVIRDGGASRARSYTDLSQLLSSRNKEAYKKQQSSSTLAPDTELESSMNSVQSKRKGSGFLSRPSRKRNHQASGQQSPAAIGRESRESPEAIETVRNLLQAIHGEAIPLSEYCPAGDGHLQNSSLPLLADSTHHATPLTVSVQRNGSKDSPTDPQVFTASQGGHTGTPSELDLTSENSGEQPLRAGGTLDDTHLHEENTGRGSHVNDEAKSHKSRMLPAMFHSFLSLSRRGSRAGSDPVHATPKSTLGSRHRAEEILFDGPEDGALMRMVDEKMTLEGLNRKKALVAARVDRMVDIHAGEDSAMYFILDKCPNEGEAIILLQHLITHGVDVNAIDDLKRSALHVAVERKYVHAAKVLLTNDSSAELCDGNNRLAVEYALDTQQDDMSALLVSHMTKERVRFLFEPQENDDFSFVPAKFIFYHLISDSADMPKTAEAVLDSLVDPTQVPDQYDFYFTILESNSEGVSPFQPNFTLGCKTIFHRLIEIEQLRAHNIVRTLIHHKWNEFGERKAWKNILFYFVFVFLTSFAFISAGRQRVAGFLPGNMSENGSMNSEYGDPRQYPDAESYFRAVCEVILLAGTVLNLYSEIREMISSEFLDYWTDKYNYVQLATIFLFLALIPLRWTDTDAQWYVAAVTYVLVCLRTLQLISVTQVVGIYLQILIEIVKKDVSKFAIIFTIFWIMFSGSTFLVLVGTVNKSGMVTGTDLDKIDDVGSYSHILLSGLRMMVQAESVVSSYQTELHWLAVVIQMFFLFALLIVILNILIAQLSDTYQLVKSNAQRTLEQNWAGALRNLEQTTDLVDQRYRSFSPSVTKDSPEDFLLSWEKPVDLSERREGDRRQRYIEQQLAKQEQQLVAIRSQMRKSLGMLQDEHVAQEQLNSTMKEMVRQQLPDVMEDIVHRNTDQVIHSLDGTTARNAREIEEHVHQRVVQEVLHMLENATDDVVARVSSMMNVEPPI